MNKRSFLASLSSLALWPFLPKAAAKPKIIGVFSPSGHFDPGGKLAELEKGWGSLPTSEDQWESCNRGVIYGLDPAFSAEGDRMVAAIYKISRQKSSFSSIIKKGPPPEGMGYNYQTILYQRSA